MADAPTAKPTPAIAASDTFIMDRPEEPRIGARQYYVIGTDDRPLDVRDVAISIAVRADLRVGDRDFSGTVCMHEVCVLRKYYELSGSGTVRLQPYWPPGIERYRGLTMDNLKSEVDRMHKRFVIPRMGSPPIVCFAELFGNQPSEQVTRMHAIMREQLEAWNKLMATARTRVTKQHEDPVVQESMAFECLTEKEMDEIANIANPAARGIDELMLPTVSVPTIPPATVPQGAPKAQGPSLEAMQAKADAEDAPDAIDRLMDNLKGAGCNQQQALEIASMLETVGSPDKLAEADIVKVLGNKSNLKAVKAILG